MLALEIEKSAVKGFMAKILRETLFDGFEVRTVEIATIPRISLDGACDCGFVTWGDIRKLAYEIIKLCPRPKQMKIIFSYKNPQEIHANAVAAFVNLVYENDSVTFTTATAQKDFTLDKTLDHAWDNYVMDFFKEAGLPVFERTELT